MYCISIPSHWFWKMVPRFEKGRKWNVLGAAQCGLFGRARIKKGKKKKVDSD